MNDTDCSKNIDVFITCATTQDRKIINECKKNNIMKNDTDCSKIINVFITCATTQDSKITNECKKMDKLFEEFNKKYNHNVTFTNMVYQCMKYKI